MSQVQPTPEEPVVELSVEECWALLADERVGRLAYRLVDEVHIVPLNYVIDGRTILFRTEPGNKLLAAELHSEVAFEVDWYDPDTAWSVLARGRLRRLGEDEEHRLDASTLHPWVATDKYDVIEVQPDVVTGRRFLLTRD